MTRWLIPLLAAGSLLSQTPSPQAPRARFRSGIDVVRIDATVLDAARQPVTDLTPQDFTILVDGAPQPIVSFDSVAVPRPDPIAAPWMREVAPDVRSNGVGEPRAIGIIMDDGTMPPGDLLAIERAKRVANAIIDQMGPADVAGVVFTLNNSQPEDFTSDRTLLRASANRFKGGMGCSELTARYSEKTLERALTYLRDLGYGRNAIMFISSDPLGSQQLLDDSLTATVWLTSDLQVMDRQSRIAPVPVYGFNISGLEAPMGDTSGNTGTVDTSSSNNSAAPLAGAHQLSNAMAALDSACGAAGNIKANNMFRTLAAMSGGRAIVDRNAPDKAVPAVFQELSAYYTIGYRATYPLNDSRERRLEIRVNRPGVTVQPAERRLIRGAAPKKVAAETPLVRAIGDLLPATDLPMAVSAAPLLFEHSVAGTGAPTGILATVQIGRTAGDTRTSDHIDVLAALLTPEGKEAASARQSADLTLHPSSNPVLIDIITPVPAKPGRYTLRVSAHSQALDKTGSVYTDVTVPDFAREPLSMSGAVLAAKPSAPATLPDAFAHLLPVMATTKRDFAPTDQASVFVRVYQGAAAPTATVYMTLVIVDANGDEKASRTDTLGSAQFDHHAADYGYDLPLGSLAAGPYLLTIEAKRNGDTVRRQVEFVVKTR